MTETTGPRPLHIDSWKTLGGRTTWYVADHYCILSMHHSEEEAQSALEAIREAREERERKWAALAEDKA